MNYFDVIVLALALAADAFSVGAAVGLTHGKFRQIFRMSFSFGLFQALMPLLGALLGTLFLEYIEQWDHWLILALLAAVGIHMIYESFRHEDEDARTRDLTKGLILVWLSITVSIDAFAAGIVVSGAAVPLAISVSIIGATTMIATAAAMSGAAFFHRFLGRRCETVAGVVLILLGVKSVLEHYKVIGF
jgi:putative Mn2+ efflux pump MntP